MPDLARSHRRHHYLGNSNRKFAHCRGRDRGAAGTADAEYGTDCAAFVETLRNRGCAAAHDLECRASVAPASQHVQRYASRLSNLGCGHICGRSGVTHYPGIQNHSLVAALFYEITNETELGSFRVECGYQ
jgi:hypothetical protein